MDKYELHNERQRAKYADAYRPMPYFVTPLTFDLIEKYSPELLEDCMVSQLAMSAAEKQILNA